jgi:hypothetical protein
MKPNEDSTLLRGGSPAPSLKPAPQIPAEAVTTTESQVPLEKREAGEFPRGYSCSLDEVSATFSKALRANFSEVSIGGTVVQANGYDCGDTPIVVVQNFIPSLREPGGMPIQINPGPHADKSLNHLSVPSLADNEIALTTPLPLGMLEYYEERGLLASRDRVISVPVDDSSVAHHGFPHFDPLSLAVSRRLELGGVFFVSAFTSRFIRSQAEQLGLKPVQMSDSFITNDKVGFGMWSEYYGYSACPRIVVTSANDVERAASRFRNSPVWVKFSHAFGGDLLFKCEAPLNSSQILGCIERMYKAVGLASKVNQYGGMSMDELWAPGDIAPRCGGIVIEQDARYMRSQSSPGKVLCTGSNLMEVHSDGSCRVKGYFEQIIGAAGEFLGSAAFDPLERFGPCMKAELDRQFGAIGRYCDERLQLQGIVGIDFMIIEDSNGEIRPVMIELNGRPPVSAFSHIVGTQKLSAPYWVSRCVSGPSTLESAGDFERLVTVGSTNYARTDWKTGAVIPMCLATVSNHGDNGSTSVLSPSPRAQVLVAGESQAHCDEIFKLLERHKGVRFNAG